MLRPAIFLMILLTVLCLAVFGQGIHHEFTNLDDNIYVSANPELEQGLSTAGLRWAFTTRLGDIWMPVTWVSYLADHQFFGSAPEPYHKTNILLHILCVLLLFIVLRRLTGTLWRAALVAALFAVHPLHVESVAWVAERKDVLSGFFFLLTIRFYLEYMKRPGVWPYLAALLCFALALMAKPMVVTLPVILLLIDFWAPPPRRPLKRLLLEKIPFLALTVALGVITVHLARTGESGAPDPVPLVERLGQAIVYYSLYLGKMFRPVNLSVFYPPESLHFPWWRVLVSALVLIAITVAAWLARRRLTAVWIGWLWFLVLLLPVLGVIQGGMQPMSDRYFYLPSIGLFIAVAWLLSWLADRASGGPSWLRFVVPILAVTVVLLAAVGSYRQTRVWQSSETLFTHALLINEDNYLAHMNLGVVLDDAGRTAEALPHLERAVQLRKDALHQFNLANALSRLDRNTEAIPYYRGALRLQPVFPTAHNNLAISLVKTGDWTAAGEHFKIAVEQQPDFAGAHYNLGLVHLHEGKTGEAAASFRRTLELAPDHRDARVQLQRLGSAGS